MVFVHSCNVQGLRKLRFNKRVYSDSPSRGEHLLRCGIDTSNRYIYITMQSHQTFYMWRAPPEMRHWYQRIHSNHYHNILQYKQSLPNNRASAQPRSTLSHFTIVYQSLPKNRATAQCLQGPGSPPNSLLRLRETPYTTLIVFPAL